MRCFLIRYVVIAAFFAGVHVCFAVPPRQIPSELYNAYTMNGQIPVEDSYWNNSYSDENPCVYKTEDIDFYLKDAKERGVGYYGGTDIFLYEMLDQYRDYIAGKSVAVIGSTIPRYESTVLAYGGHPVTIEYNKIICEDPRIKVMTVKEFEENPLEFDVVVSISSIEHDGLGRYGDPINPWGDMMAMEKMKGMLKEGGILFLAVPVGSDCLFWNAHRVYGRIRLPLLLEGWEVMASSGFSLADYDLANSGWHQPVFVLRPQHGEMKCY